MLLTALPAAGAVDSASEGTLAKHAGETITCQIFEDTASGLISRMVEVDIPEDATMEEELALARAAAIPAASSRAARGLADVSTMYNLNIGPKDLNETLVGSGNLPLTFQTLYITFDNLIPRGSATKLYVRLENVTRGRNYNKTLTLGTVTDFVFFVCSRDSTLIMHSGDLIHAFASTNSNTVTADACRIFGYEEDLG